MKNNDGGPAFPNGLCDSSSGAFHLIDGMSLRDYFAAKAMQGMLSNPYYMEEMYEYFKGDNLKIGKSICESAYAVADAMLKARES